jgi:hypothetical protein
MDRRGRRVVRARRLAEIRAGSWPFATASSSGFGRGTRAATPTVPSRTRTPLDNHDRP